jgi:multicomponent Na+:H+ antiporter subunit C
MSGVALVGLLVAAGVWFIGAPGRVRTVLGFVLLSHAVNVLLLLGATGSGTTAAFVGDDGVDPLPQAFVLTAIVIGFGVTALMLALAASLRRDEAEGAFPDHLGPGAGPDGEEADELADPATAHHGHVGPRDVGHGGGA